MTQNKPNPHFQTSVRQMQFFIIIMITSFILSLYRIYASIRIDIIGQDPCMKGMETTMGFISGFIPVCIIETPIQILTGDDFYYYFSYSVIGTILTSFIYAIFSAITIICHRQINMESRPHYIAAALTQSIPAIAPIADAQKNQLNTFSIN